MSHEEATEYFWYNVAGSGGGGTSPELINTPEERSDVSWTVNSSYLT